MTHSSLCNNMAMHSCTQFSDCDRTPERWKTGCYVE